ncbi:uncharacterized protein LOC128472607 [Spea bombifrons]|uniref:uncharacterized protein LOC128472607 n=1 Tax=Spea bombifrons TaxID=233779 RepID=UPI0023496A73|nr:uncharacterized protein LOC128472607 [Spea bombifrons]
MEQFFWHCHEDIRNWVRDRKPLTLSDVARLADEYVANRDIDMQVRHHNPLTEPLTRQPWARAPAGNTRPKTENTPSFPTRTTSFTPRQSSPGKQCYRCNGFGHVQAQCPRSAVVGFVQGEPYCKFSPVTETVYEAYTTHLPSNSSLDRHMQAVTVGGRPFTGLRDSGATITLVKPKCLPPNNLLPQEVTIRTAGGAYHTLPTAKIHLNWGTGQGTVVVGVMDGLPADVLLGNDLGMLVSQYRPQEEITAVTRSQTRGNGNLAVSEPAGDPSTVRHCEVSGGTTPICPL